MVHRITITSTYDAEPPDFATWSSDILDPNVVWNKFPQYSGIPISTIVTEKMSIENDVASGFISEYVTFDTDSLRKVLITDWETQADYIKSLKKVGSNPYYTPGNITCNTSSITVVGVNTYFSSNLSIGEYLTVYDVDSNSSVDVGQIASIESDTSLTLENNASLNVTSVPYTSLPVMSFIKNLYHQTYPFTLEITYANV